MTSCAENINEPGPARVRHMLAVEEAIAQRDYGAVYRLSKQLAISDGDASFEVGLLLTGWLELACEGDSSCKDWYRPELMASVPMPERQRAAVLWFRRGAYQGSSKAILRMKDLYERGSYGFPRNNDLASCFELAELDKGKLATCKQLELSAGLLELPE